MANEERISIHLMNLDFAQQQNDYPNAVKVCMNTKLVAELITRSFFFRH